MITPALTVENGNYIINDGDLSKFSRFGQHVSDFLKYSAKSYQEMLHPGYLNEYWIENIEPKTSTALTFVYCLGNSDYKLMFKCRFDLSFKCIIIHKIEPKSGTYHDAEVMAYYSDMYSLLKNEGYDSPWDKFDEAITIDEVLYKAVVALQS